MDSLIMYITEAFWIFIHSLVPSIIIYAIINIALYLFKKRNTDFYKNNKLKIVGECLFIISLFVILRITGITDGSYYVDGLVRISSIEIGIPFCGASELMVFLNTLMFVPFGFFAAMAFKKLNWLKVFLISFGTTFLIEFLQLFNGRKSELDDIIANLFGAMCGYFIFRGIEALIKKKSRKIGVIIILTALLCSSLYTVTVHCLADGDRIQAETNEMYHEIYNEDIDYDCISISCYSNGFEHKIDCTDNNSEYFEIYNSFGLDISNQAYSYTEDTKQGNISDVKSENNDEYLIINYSEPQSFNFYNNKNLKIENAETLMYNLNNGTLYFSEENTENYKVWTLDTSKMPYYKDEYLYELIKKFI